MSRPYLTTANTQCHSADIVKIVSSGQQALLCCLSAYLLYIVHCNEAHIKKLHSKYCWYDFPYNRCKTDYFHDKLQELYMCIATSRTVIHKCLLCLHFSMWNITETAMPTAKIWIECPYNYCCNKVKQLCCSKASKVMYYCIFIIPLMHSFICSQRPIFWPCLITWAPLQYVLPAQRLLYFL